MESRYSSLCHRFSRVKLGNMLISSKLAKSDRSSYIYAKWFNTLTETAPQDMCRPGYVYYFLKHTIKLENSGKIFSNQSILASVGWYKCHPEQYQLLSPLTIWSPDYEPLNLASFLPINRILCRCAHIQKFMEFADRPYNNGQAVVIIPIGYVE